MAESYYVKDKAQLDKIINQTMYSLTKKPGFIHRQRCIDSTEHHLSTKKKKVIVHNGLQNLRIVSTEKLAFSPIYYE